MAEQEVFRIERVIMRAVSRSFGATTALRGIDIVFSCGEGTLIEGPNGSGKTTLLGILATAIRPSSGDVTFEPPEGLKNAAALGRVENIRRQIGWVTHDAHAYLDLTARQNLQLAAALYRADAGQVRRWATAFELDAFAERPVRQLSRGQRQRVALARAFVHAPSVVLLDEPTSGLDADGTKRLLDAVSDAVARGAIVVLVTHDAAIANAVARRRIKLDRGRLVA